jgi:hypothetical protein
LVFSESLGKIWCTGAKKKLKKIPLPRSCPNIERPKFGFKEFWGINVLENHFSCNE